ncbi:hypothetical protein EIP86_006482 [Pleurotus ostreatoroseus]|nr:hypothetical protein EIP86_006482 [Pleurotus ostreatoroseus]
MPLNYSNSPTTPTSRATPTSTNAPSSGTSPSLPPPPPSPLTPTRSWKQRDIHEKRELRKLRIAQLRADLACNDVLAPRLHALLTSVSQGGSPAFSAATERLRTHPAPDAPPSTAPPAERKTYDAMLLALLLQIWEDVKAQGVTGDDPRLGDALVKGLQTAVDRMAAHQDKLRTEIEAEEAEQHRKITSDDIHDGFDSHYVPPKPAPPPVKGAIPPLTKDKPAATVTEFETLNPRAASSSSSSPSNPSSTPTDPDDDSEDASPADLPQLTPSLETFSRLPLHAYEASWEHIKAHRDVIVPGASDALLVAAFDAQGRGESRYAQQCVHQSLLLSYCEKLGGDGVRVFFQKMIARDPRATAVFEKDVADTYAHLVTRVASLPPSPPSAPTEQIQLVPENPSATISFNVPTGPPPEHITLEGPGLAGVDPADVRRALQMRWDVFEAFSEEMRAALGSGRLEEVNAVLGAMKVEEAEEVVRLLDVAGILSFAEHGVRDVTGEGEEEAGEEEEEGEEEEGEEEEGEEEEEEEAGEAVSKDKGKGKASADDVD